MQLVLTARRVKNVEVQDAILAGLLRESPVAKSVLARRLQYGTGGPGTTVAFEEIYALGEGAANGITAVVLDPAAWTSEESREDCERDVFQLYLAKMMEVGHDYDGRAMKGVARLLAADAPRLHRLVDEDTFDMILSTLDYRNPIELKSQATLATAKYLEASGGTGQSALTSYVTVKVGIQTSEDLILAFSAAAAVFPVTPVVASALFLAEGFLQSLIPLLERKAKSKKVEHAALEMLSAACIDTACRDAINKHCRPWLQQVLEVGEDERPGLAAITLAKLVNPALQTDAEHDAYENKLDGLVKRLQNMLRHDSPVDKQGSIEGLAYASANSRVKEELAYDKTFLEELLKDLSTSDSNSLIAFGCLNLINNLCRYLPKLSEEQKRISQLKAYANASKPSTEPDPFDQEPAVKSRCIALINAGTVSAIVTIGKKLSPASITLVFNILLSLSWPQSHRGTIAQQGGVKLLLQLYTRITSTAPESVRARQTAAHGLARTLASVDPSLVFPASGVPSVMSAIRPIVSLLSEEPATAVEGPRDLLPTFEALLALANLLVAPSNGAAELIVRLAVPVIEDLILHDNTGIRRASTQVMTNLAQHDAGIALYADGSDIASRRLHVLLALSGSEDLETRKAAGGALAMLTESEEPAKAIMNMERGPVLLLGMLEDSEEEMLHRGLVCVANLVMNDSQTATLAKTKLKTLGLENKLKAVAKSSKSTDVLGTASEILRFMEQ